MKNTGRKTFKEVMNNQTKIKAGRVFFSIGKMPHLKKKSGS